MSVYDAVTEQILKELETGTPPWVQSWQPRQGVEHEYSFLKWSALAGKAADYLRSFSRGEAGAKNSASLPHRERSSGWGSPPLPHSEPL